MDDFDGLWSECFSCIPFWICLHFFDRSLSLESDFWSFTFCRLLLRRGRVSCLKSHKLPICWHITHEDFLRLIFRNSFYALLCRRSVCTILLKFNFRTFISLANYIVMASPPGKVLPVLGVVLSAVYQIHRKKMIFPWHLSNLRLHNCSFCNIYISKTSIKNIKTPSGLARVVSVSTRFHANSQNQSPNDVIESHQTNSSKIICVFSIPGTMFWEYIFTETNSKLNSTPLQTFPFTRISNDAYQHGYHPVTQSVFYNSKSKSLIQGRVRWNRLGDYFKP